MLAGLTGFVSTYGHRPSARLYAVAILRALWLLRGLSRSGRSITDQVPSGHFLLRDPGQDVLQLTLVVPPLAGDPWLPSLVSSGERQFPSSSPIKFW